MDRMFSEQEGIIQKKFEDQFSNQIDLCSRLFEHYEQFIKALDHKYKPEDRPRYTIQMLLCSNLSTLNNSLQNLLRGYLPASQSILRGCMENLIFAMYFFEFPDHEKKYRENPKGIASSLRARGYDQEWLQAHLARVDNEGVKIAKIDDEEDAWQNRVYRNITNECSNFVHMNFEYLESATYGDSGIYILGPNWINDLVMENGIWKIIEATLLNLAMFDRIFKTYLEEVSNKDLFDEVVASLNKWKEHYNNSAAE